MVSKWTEYICLTYFVERSVKIAFAKCGKKIYLKVWKTVGKVENEKIANKKKKWMSSQAVWTEKNNKETIKTYKAKENGNKTNENVSWREKKYVKMMRN